MPLMERSHAVVVGIANYESVRPLPSAVRNDARAVYDLLVDPDYCGYSALNVRLLLDGCATAQALRDEFSELARRTEEMSNLFIYFSGHGGRLETGPYAGEYLLPADTQFLAEQGPELKNALSATELSGLMDALPGVKQVVALDCCHADGLTKDGVGTDLLPPGIKGLSGSYEVLESGRGRAVLAASRDSEPSWILDANHSLFTRHLLAGLRGGAASDDGFIRLFELFNYVQRAVIATKPEQHPVLKFHGEENLALARYRGGSLTSPQRAEDGFRYDVYLSYADQDDEWVYSEFLPRLEKAGLSVVTSNEVAAAGVPRVASVKDGVRDSRRTLALLSGAYIEDNWAEFGRVLALTRNVVSRTWSFVPVKIKPIDEARLDLSIAALVSVDLTRSYRADRDLQKLIEQLKQPVPTWR